MDENYLDRLLREVEKQNITIPEEEASVETAKPEVVQSQVDSNLEMEQTLTADASNIHDVAWSDSEIPVEGISELDELDELADLDMDSMDFDDIDFDDIDVTNMNVNPVQFQKELENLEELNIDETYLDESDDQAFEEEFQRMKASEQEADSMEALLQETENAELLQDSITDNTGLTEDFVAGNAMDVFDDVFKDATSDITTEQNISDTSNVSQDSDESADEFDIDSLMKEVFGEDAVETSPAPKAETKTSASSMDDLFQESHESASEQFTTNENTSNSDDMDALFASMMDGSATDSSASSGSADDMDDLFAMLGIESGSAVSEPIPVTDEIPDFEIPPELADVEDISAPKKKKKGFMDVLFGDDEEDALTPEQEAEIAKEKEAKKQARLEKKAQQKAKKAENDAIKKKAQKEKEIKVAAKKAARKAADEKLLAEDGPEKKLNKPLVVIIMVFFFLVGATIIVGTGVFDYTLVITKATNYFERQKYGMAYREIIGVDVKEEDRPLEDKIYTVMYVERQYEAYENYVKMNRHDLALDALLQGLGKYDEYYPDAIELGIEEDINVARGKIVDALASEYHLDLQSAYMMLQLERAEYTLQIQEITAPMSVTEEE